MAIVIVKNIQQIVITSLLLTCTYEVHAFTKSPLNFKSFPNFKVLNNSSSTKNHLNNRIGNGIALLSKYFFEDDNLNRRKLLCGSIVASVLSSVSLVRAYTSTSSGYYTFEISELATERLEEPDNGWDSIEDVTIVFHGAGGQDQYTAELMTKLGKQSNKKSYVVMVDWYDYSQKLLKASFEGQRIGKIIAEKMVDDAKNLKNVHVIGISVGAFAADSCVSQVKQLAKVYAQLTLLDPFTQRGIIGINYGADNFGKTADYAQQFLNTDDPVPSTNKPLPYCAVTDVTNVRPSDVFGHDWPLIYYSRSNDLGFVPKYRRLDTGSVTKVF